MNHWLGQSAPDPLSRQSARVFCWTLSLSSAAVVCLFEQTVNLRPVSCRRRHHQSSNEETMKPQFYLMSGHAEQDRGTAFWTWMWIPDGSELRGTAQTHSHTVPPSSVLRPLLTKQIDVVWLMSCCSPLDSRLPLQPSSSAPVNINAVETQHWAPWRPHDAFRVPTATGLCRKISFLIFLYFSHFLCVNQSPDLWTQRLQSVGCL